LSGFWGATPACGSLTGRCWSVISTWLPR
jgi:hypothetical protein